MIEFIWSMLLLGSGAGMYVTRRRRPAYYRWTVVFGLLLAAAAIHIMRQGPLRELLNLLLFFERHEVSLTVLLILSLGAFVFARNAGFMWSTVVLAILVATTVVVSLILGWLCLLAVVVTGVLFALLWQRRDNMTFRRIRWVGAAMLAWLLANLFVSYLFFESNRSDAGFITHVEWSLVSIAALLGLFWAWRKKLRGLATFFFMVIVVCAAGLAMFESGTNVSRHMDLLNDVALSGLLIVFAVAAVLWVLRAQLQPLGWASAVLILFLGSGLFLTKILYGQPEDFVDIEDQFKYGSIGSDHFLARGIPYYIWQVLPRMFPPEYILTKRILPPQGVDEKPYRPRYGKLDGETGDDERSGTSDESRASYDERGTSYEAFGLLREHDRNVRILTPEEDVIQSIDRPIGFSKRKVFGVDFVGINCAFCHASSIKAGNETKHSETVLGMPANTVDIELFFLYLFGVAEEQDFRSGKIMTAILQTNPLLKLGAEARDRGWCAVCQELKNSFHRLIYRLALIPLTGWYAKRLKKDFDFIDPENSGHNPRFGPGRVDAWSPGKRTLIKPPLVVDYPGGIIDDTSIWNQKARNGMRFHWDGNTNDINERNIIAGLVVNGPQIECLDVKRVLRITDWIMERPAPRMDDFNRAVDEHPKRNKDNARSYAESKDFCVDEKSMVKALKAEAKAPKDQAPDKAKSMRTKEPAPVKVESTDTKGNAPGLNEEGESFAEKRLRMVKEGASIFEHWCAACHAPEGSRIGRVEPLYATELQTDPARMKAFNVRLQNALNTIGRDTPYPKDEDSDITAWKLRKFRAQDGYLNMLLDGIWLRAPYLHNGSVPTLWQLLWKPCPREGSSCRKTTFHRGNVTYDADEIGFKYETDEEKEDVPRWHTIGFLNARILSRDRLTLLSNDGRLLRATVGADGMVELDGNKVELKDLTAAEAMERIKQQPNWSRPVDQVLISREMPKAKTTYFEFDTTLPGNSNHGHLYGTDLDCKQKMALLEFLKTL